MPCSTRAGLTHCATRRAKSARAQRVVDRWKVETQVQPAADTLTLAQPVFADRYADNRATGSFILIDEATNDTVAAGMVR